MGIIDDLTGGPPPKRVSERELKGTWSESGIYGKMQLKDRKLAQFKAIVAGSMDEDTHRGRRFKGITEKEIPEIVEQMKMSKSFNSHEIEKAEKHLRAAL
ncbi:MAG: hypothetical protein HYT94_05290 [Parcubacteria group bacterium]|nr:hypothetical protein [Parcubacteria group bacterium]